MYNIVTHEVDRRCRSTIENGAILLVRRPGDAARLLTEIEIGSSPILAANMRIELSGNWGCQQSSKL